jgi:hypothetical protein
MTCRFPRTAHKKPSEHSRTISIAFPTSSLPITGWKSSTGPERRAFLGFLDGNREVTAVRVRKKSPWFLSLFQRFNAVPGTEGFLLRTIEYAYRIQKAPNDEALVRFEYVARDAEPEFDYCRKNVQFHADFHGVFRNFSPSKLHIPTGWVTIERVIRFLFTDFKVKPLRTNWEKILADSERQFREWTGRTVPDSDA